ncbi:MAG: pilus assembly protein PilP [Desulfatitalea sp.]
MVLLAGVLACGEEPPPAPKPKAVSQKIAKQTAQPTLPTPAAAPDSATSETAAPPATTPVAPAVSPAPMVETPTMEKTGQTQVTGTPDAPTSQPGAAAVLEPAKTTPAASEVGAQAAPAPPTPTAAGASELVKASLQIAASYDPEGRFDPFEPLFKEQSTQSTTSAKDKRNKRTPQTPLERVALAQLKVTAIIRAASGNRALVEDATGKGYVVQIGTYMGLNSGQVIRIDNDRIVVEEEIESVVGELTVQNSELKLQKPAGEL